MAKKYLVVGYLGKVFSCRYENMTWEAASQIFEEWRYGWKRQSNLGGYFELLLRKYGIACSDIREHLGFPGGLAVAVKHLDQRLRSSLLSVATENSLREFIEFLKKDNVDDAVFGVPSEIAGYPYPIVDIVFKNKHRYERAFAPKGFSQYLVKAATSSLMEYYDINGSRTDYDKWIINNIRESTSIFLLRGGFYLATHNPVLKALAEDTGKNIVFVPGMRKDFNVINRILGDIEENSPSILKNHHLYVIFDTYDFTGREINTNTELTRDRIDSTIIHYFRNGTFRYRDGSKWKTGHLDKIIKYTDIVLYATLWDCIPGVRNVKIAVKPMSSGGFKYYDWRLNTDCKYFDTGGDEELFAVAFIYAYRTLNMSFEDALKYAASTVYTAIRTAYYEGDHSKVISSLTDENIRKTMNEIFK